MPDAQHKISFDKFHVAKYLGDALDKVRRREQKQHFAYLRESTLRTARAWAMRQEAMGLWDYKSRSWAQKGWLGWAQRCRLEPMKKVGQTIKRQACGFRNRERFRNAIYFHCGGLDLYPDAISA